MKHVRRLTRHLDELRMVWRQIEAALDRVESARDTDDPGRLKTEALLDAASAIERLRTAAGLVTNPLGDAVVDSIPTSGIQRTDGATVPIADGWSEEVRPGRLPGTDEIEIAVSDLAPVPLPDVDLGLLSLPEITGDLLMPAVRLHQQRTTLPAALGDDEEPHEVVVPSYPGWAGTISGFTTANLEIDTLFDLGLRHRAAVAESLDEAIVGTWPNLVGRRRAKLPVAPVPPFTGIAASGAPFDAALRTTAESLVADARQGLSVRLPFGTHAATALMIAQAATAANSTSSADARALNDAAGVIDDEGVESESEDLADMLREAAAWAGDSDTLMAISSAANALTAALGALPLGLPVSPAVRLARVAAADALDSAIDGLPAASALPALLGLPVEVGGVGDELDVVIGDRIAYPDGTLRLLRAVELGFGRWWPLAERQLSIRTGVNGPLTRALRRFLNTFVVDLTALINGTRTSFGADSVTLQPVNVGAVAMTLDAPASTARSTAQLVEVGQIALVSGVRPAAAVALGVEPQGQHLSLRMAPLRVSLVPPDVAEGTPGLIEDGAVVSAGISGGLSSGELRRGFADDPVNDGLVETAVGISSQLALLGGTELVSPGGQALVPDPHGGPLRSTEWHGRLPRMVVSFVFHGVPDVWWDRPDPKAPPLPLMVRPGELLLLRGHVDAQPMADEGSPGASPVTAQTVVEVDRALWLSGRMFEQLDLTRTAVLAADQDRLGGIGEPKLICGHDEDLMLVTLRRTWQTRPMTGPVTLRRDFVGFDGLTLGVDTILNAGFVSRITGSPPDTLGTVDRRDELSAASGFLTDWTRYGR